MNEILVPMAAADVIDRLAMLGALAEGTNDRASLQERDMLERVIDRVLTPDTGLHPLRAALRQTYGDLHALEADLRGFESRADFGPAFVGVARSYLAILDQRDRIRADIAAQLRQPSGAADVAMSGET